MINFGWGSSTLDKNYKMFSENTEISKYDLFANTLTHKIINLLY